MRARDGKRDRQTDRKSRVLKYMYASVERCTLREQGEFGGYPGVLGQDSFGFGPENLQVAMNRKKRKRGAAASRNFKFKAAQLPPHTSVVTNHRVEVKPERTWRQLCMRFHDSTARCLKRGRVSAFIMLSMRPHNCRQKDTTGCCKTTP